MSRSIINLLKGPIKQTNVFICKNVDRVASWKTTCHRWQYSKLGHRHNTALSTHTQTGCKGMYYWNKYKSVEEACIGR